MYAAISHAFPVSSIHNQLLLALLLIQHHPPVNSSSVYPSLSWTRAAVTIEIGIPQAVIWKTNIKFSASLKCFLAKDKKRYKPRYVVQKKEHRFDVAVIKLWTLHKRFSDIDAGDRKPIATIIFPAAVMKSEIEIYTRILREVDRISFHKKYVAMIATEPSMERIDVTVVKTMKATSEFVICSGMFVVGGFKLILFTIQSPNRLSHSVSSSSEVWIIRKASLMVVWLKSRLATEIHARENL